jgi:hypothetical protein
MDQDEKLMKIMDPLFVILASLEIMKHRSKEGDIRPEIDRMESALNKISQIIN